MKFRSGLLAATMLVAAPVAAKAQAVNGLYIGAGAGANFMHDQSVSGASFPATGPLARFNGLRGGDGDIKARMDTGFVGLVSVGYGFGNGLRLEVEGGYRQNDFDQLASSRLTLGRGASAGGTEQKYSGMVNVLYDFDSRLFGFLGLPAFTPYIGVGAGYAWTQHRNTRFSGNTGPLPGTGFPNGFNSLLRTNDGDGAFAYQAIVGGAFPIAAVPGLSITAEYRFFGLAESRRYNYQTFVANTPSFRSRVRFEDDYNHSVLLGVRYAFNTPRPAPPPVAAPVAPAPAPARSYLVFFDWDRADLTDRARQIIAEAAQATTRVQVTRIEVAGHADTSGTPSYNQGLSQRRAQNVASELVRLGVPREAITVQAFGESRPLVPTGDGVREPQNRRVEIVLR